jgi:hypothetical protein
MINTQELLNIKIMLYRLKKFKNLKKKVGAKVRETSEWINRTVNRNQKISIIKSHLNWTKMKI